MAHSGTISHVCERYIAHARRTYVRPTPDGRYVPTREDANVSLALRDLIATHGKTRASRLSSAMVRALRLDLVEQGLTASTINARTRIIARAFEWAGEMGLVPCQVGSSIRAITPLPAGSGARSRGVDAVEPSVVSSTIAELPPHPADLVRFLMLTACRVSEAREARSDEIHQTTAGVFLRPAWHKNANHGHVREIPIIPAAWEIVSPRMDREYLFGVDDGSKPYNRDAIGQAIRRAADRAGVPRWSPGQIRHTAATTVFEAGGLEAARVVLGHQTTRVTPRYLHSGEGRRAIEAAGALHRLAS